MKELAYLLRPEEPYLLVVPISQELKDLQQTVGGYIEQVRISEGITFLVNEEPLPGTPLNLIATMLAAQYGKAFINGISGVVVVFGKPYAKGWREAPAGVLGHIGEIMRQMGVLDDLPQR